MTILRPRGRDDETGLAEPVQHDGALARRGAKARGERFGKADLVGPDRHHEAALSRATRAISSKRGPEVGMSTWKTSAITCVQPWRK